MITVVADFPTEHNLSDGMMQRIRCIDGYLPLERRYLCISWRRNFFIRVERSEGAEVIYCNSVIHFFIILRILFNSKQIYIHSIYNFVRVFIPIFLLNVQSRNIYLDIHGVVPEEIKYFETRALTSLKSSFFSFIEKSAIARCGKVLCVSHNMITHFIKKYTNANVKKFVWLPIEVKLNNSDLGSNEISIIYAGGDQRWQNISEMIEFSARNNRFVKSTAFYVPKRAVESVKLDLKDYCNVTVDSASHTEVLEIYKNYSCGLIFRDDSVVNRVASPTKLMEYLGNGLAPVLKYDNLGDFLHYGFKYVAKDEFSKVGIDEIREIISHNKEVFAKLKNDILVSYSKFFLEIYMNC